LIVQINCVVETTLVVLQFRPEEVDVPATSNAAVDDPETPVGTKFVPVITTVAAEPIPSVPTLPTEVIVGALPAAVLA
jgi:hypothetical protein